MQYTHTTEHARANDRTRRREMRDQRTTKLITEVVLSSCNLGLNEWRAHKKPKERWRSTLQMSRMCISYAYVNYALDAFDSLLQN